MNRIEDFLITLLVTCAVAMVVGVTISVLTDILSDFVSKPAGQQRLIANLKDEILDGRKQWVTSQQKLRVSQDLVGKTEDELNVALHRLEEVKKFLHPLSNSVDELLIELRDDDEQEEGD